jgi:AAHS family 4-hydroxybenzoate transporter-like MFS transporter
MTQTYRIETLVDEGRLGAFNVQLLAWSFLAMFADGFDISALASAVPELVRTWHVKPQDFGPALSASLIGILLGAPLLGALGDRRGRRVAVVTGSLIFGIGTLATVWASSLTHLIVLRFITGIGIGGLMPNLVALNSELAPRRWRAMLIVLMFTGITAGSGTPGTIQAWLIPKYGWPIMFWIGGLVPIVVGLLLAFKLPESVKFMATRPERRAELLATLRRLRPDLTIAEDAQIISQPAPPATGTGLRELFSGALALMTPLLWVCFVTALMANFFLNSWLPLIFESHGLSPHDAGIATSLYHYGGLVGGLLVSVVLARFGFAATAVLFLLAAPAIAALGMPGNGFYAMASFAGLAGFFVLGAQFGNNASSGLLYPTYVRSRGVGWALGVGRFGSIVGPLLGAKLIGMKLPLQQLFLLAAIPMVVGVVAAILLTCLSYRRSGSLQLDDSTVGR